MKRSKKTSVCWIAVAGLMLLASSYLAVPSYAQVTFTDVTKQAGIEVGKGYQNRIALGDYDGDGDIDIYLSEPSGGRLYRNNGDGTFTDVTKEAGVTHRRYAEGAAFGDYDNDGNPDLYIGSGGRTSLERGPDLLYRNNGDGTFTDVTKEAGIIHEGHCSGLAFWDYDNDGLLDIYVADFGRANLLYRNNGDGTFTDVAKEAGVWRAGYSTTIACGDYDNDGFVDLYEVKGGIAAFTGERLRTSNVLYHNNRDGTFTDVTEKAGVRYSRCGRDAAFGDYDNDGDLDLYVANYDPNALYRNNGDGTFTDVIEEARVQDLESSWGVDFGDVDNDGFPDIYMNNSHPVSAVFVNFLFHNNRDGTFTDIAEKAGVAGKRTKCFALGDMDDDGFPDLLTGAYAGGAKLYHNNGNSNHWLHVTPVGTLSNRSGIGARVRVVSGDLSQIREVSSEGKNGNHNSLRPVFGLGARVKVDSLVIRWPSGLIQTFTDVAVDRKLVVTEGEGGTWEHHGPSYVLGRPLIMPEETLADGTMKTTLTVKAIPVPFGEGELSEVTADLSPIGGSPEALMYDDGTHGDRTAGDGIYTLQTTVPPGTQPGKHCVKITVEDNLSRKVSALRSLVVYPGGDEYLYQDQIGSRWEVKVIIGELDLKASNVVHSGSHSHAVTLKSVGGIIRYTFKDPESFFTFGYTGLEFWINPGTSSTEKAGLVLNTPEGYKSLKLRDDLGISLEPNIWQVVSIPLEELGLVDTRLKYLQLSGVEGTFYIDDLAFVVAEYRLAEALATPEKVKPDGKMFTVLTVQAVPAVTQPGAPPLATIDLSPIGGSPEMAMSDDGTRGDKSAGDGIYTVRTTVGPEIPNGLKELAIALTDRRLRVAHARIPLSVLPTEEAYVYRDEIARGWKERTFNILSDPSATSFVYEGEHSLEISLDKTFTAGLMSYSWDDPEGFGVFGYELVFQILVTEPGQDPELVLGPVIGESLKLSLGDELGEPGTWQEIRIPLGMLAEPDFKLKRVSFQVPKESATFYLDNMRFVPEEVPELLEPTAVEVSEGRVVPSGYSLSQNYPNPFNPETTIRYDLPKAGTVRLFLYNVSGQRIRTLVDGERPAGTYSVTWDGRDDAGRDVASGVYLCRMDAGEFSAVRKMLLIQ